MDCYRKFTAISKLSKRKLSEVVVESTESKEEQSKPRLSRSVAPGNMTSPGSRVFSKACLFCEQSRKKVKGQKQKLIRCEVKNDLEGSSSLGASHCCLHSGEGNHEGEIHSFTKESLSKCRLVRFLRIKQSLRFSNISLPKDLPTTAGYLSGV